MPCAYARFEKRAEKRERSGGTEEYRAMVVVYGSILAAVLIRVVRHSAVYCLCP